MRSQQNALSIDEKQTSIDLDLVSELFPNASSLTTTASERVEVRNETGEVVGFVLQTSPTSDHIIGFSGSTNVLVGLSNDELIVGIRVIGSGDTRDHVRQVVRDERFMQALNGLSVGEAKIAPIDAVSGATLTSVAMREAVALRLGASSQRSLKFPEPPTLSTFQNLFPDADVAQPRANDPTLWIIRNAEGIEIGTVLRTSPAADNTIGFQGPTDSLVGFDADGNVVGVVVATSYDNEPYVGYVRDDAYFSTLFNKQQLDELALYDPAESEFEGVSGATMTSMAVAEGIGIAAASRVARLKRQQQSDAASSGFFDGLSRHDWGTLLCVALGVAIGFTRLRSNATAAFLWRVVLIVYLGFIAGNLLSQAQLVGWSQHGVPIRKAFGLFCLAVAALSIPIATKRNIYCSHLCPHGAAQQLLRRRLPWQVTLPRKLKSLLRLVPGLLLLWCVVVGMSSIGFSLVDIEPFDAYVFRIAGWATIAVAIVGLLASLFVPMAYCRYGCPTGAMLEFLRFNAKADRWNRRDWFSLFALLVAIVIRLC